MYEVTPKSFVSNFWGHFIHRGFFCHIPLGHYCMHQRCFSTNNLEFQTGNSIFASGSFQIKVSRFFMRKGGKIIGRSYLYRVEDILRIYDEHSRSGLSNREILRRYIWPKWHICERTFYNIINASAEPRIMDGLANLNSQLSLFG